MREYRHVARCTSLIQKFYRARYAEKTRAATLVKQFLKGKRVYKRYQRLKDVRRGTKDILD